MTWIEIAREHVKLWSYKDHSPKRLCKTLEQLDFPVLCFLSFCTILCLFIRGWSGIQLEAKIGWNSSFGNCIGSFVGEE